MSGSPVAPISLLYRSSEGIDGIAAYCRQLGPALTAAGAPTQTVDWRGHGVSVRDGDLILQYNPFSFGRWGFAPRLAFDMLALRRNRPAIRLALMVHEPFVPIVSARSLVMSVWQRLQLRALLAAADVVMVSTSAWTPRLPAGCRPVATPVGSNLPDRRERRLERRRSLGIAGNSLVLATFGTDHPARRLDHVVAAANAVAAHRRVVLLCLGSATKPLSGLDPRVWVHRPGRQSDEDLAGDLSTADIYLAAFVDGLSTRRGTLMAALQHGLAVVGTAGPLTEPDLRRESAIRWSPIGDLARFADSAVKLACDPLERERRRIAARALYERRFSWERIATVVLETLAGTPRRARRA